MIATWNRALLGIESPRSLSMADTVNRRLYSAKPSYQCKPPPAHFVHTDQQTTIWNEDGKEDGVKIFTMVPVIKGIVYPQDVFYTMKVPEHTQVLSYLNWRPRAKIVFTPSLSPDTFIPVNRRYTEETMDHKDNLECGYAQCERRWALAKDKVYWVQAQFFVGFSRFKSLRCRRCKNKG